MIKKRIKMQLKKAVSTFAGTALSGILCAVLLTGCGTLQNGEMPLPAESETSRSNDQTEEKTKGEDAEDGEITGSTEKTDDTEEPKTSGTGKTVPEIWNREWPSNVDLPSSYDYREHERAPKIGNQGSLGTCWAFASLTALESTLLPKQKETFSVDHMSMHNHFLLGQDEGGEYTMSMAYLLSWEGPVWESEDPYGDGFSPDGLKAREHVQEIQILPSKDYEAIKKAVYLEGGVQSSLYTSMRDYESESVYYNRDTNSYCYIGTEKPNHDSVIVGWDDDYPKENFNMELEGDGAFICTNSWGENFGDQGYFYVSYYDTNIGVHNIVYTGIEPTDNYDNIYQSDLCGWVGQIGYGEDTAWFANAYKTKTKEELAAAGFYATGAGTEYKIYAARNLPDRDSTGKEKLHQDHMMEMALNKRILLAEGKMEYTGYYTIPFNEKIVLDQGEKFAIIVEIKTPDTVHPVAIEYDAGDGIAQVDLTDGEGYLSHNGSLWEHVEEAQKCNLCLKVYTHTEK